MDELDLGLPPSKKKKRGMGAVVPGIVYRPYNVKKPPICDDCLANAAMVNGVPKFSLERARFIRREGGDKRFICSMHQALRKESEAGAATP